MKTALTWRRDIRRIIGPSGAVALSPCASSMFDVLWRAGGQYVDYDRLMGAVWGHCRLPDDLRGNLKQYAWQIRRALQLAGADVALTTVKYYGYRIGLPETVQFARAA